MKGKYVIFWSQAFGFEYPVLLPGAAHFVQHAHLHVRNDKPISAGFFSIADEDVNVWGKSISLKLGSRGKDAKIINDFLVN